MRISKKLAPQSKVALGRYLAAGLGATGLASVECEAAIVTLNLSAIGTPAQNITGVNAGLTYAGGWIVLSDAFSQPGSIAYIGNIYPTGSGNMTGFVDSVFTRFANGGSVSTPKIFSVGQLVDGAASNNWASVYNAAFKTNAISAPSITGPGNYMGFRDGPLGGPYNYGYFEVTWNAGTEQFQILSGAYESTPNTPIAVPEPSTIALMGIGALALGTGAIRKSRKAAAERTLAETV